MTALERLLGLRADLLRPLDFNGAKTPELIGLAKETASGEVDLEAITNLDKRERIA